MTFELIIIFIVICFSVVFKYSEDIKLNSQFVFIFLCLLTLIIYKYMIYYRINKNVNKEGFNNFSSEINNFLTSNVARNSSPDEIKQYNESLTQLKDKVDVMNEYLQEINNIAKGKGNNKANTEYDELNIQASQQIQDYRIKQLQKDIEQTTDLIKKSKLNQDAKSFKKIPVYSSCIISNADGSMSVDNPSSNSSSSSRANNIINLNNQLPMNQLQPDNLDSIRNRINQGNDTGSDSNNGNGNSNIMSNLFNSIQENGIDINIES
jgi:hypothetical protein